MASWVKLSEAAPRLDIPERTLRSLALAAVKGDGYLTTGPHRIPVIRVGRSYRIPAGYLERLEDVDAE